MCFVCEEGALSGKVQAGGGEHSVQALPESHKQGACWKLRRWFYGMRPAAREWEEDCAERLLRGERMERGGEASTCFYCPAGATRALAHSNDFVPAGPRARAH